jgi:hypothetical protein
MNSLLPFHSGLNFATVKQYSIKTDAKLYYDRDIANYNGCILHYVWYTEVSYCIRVHYIQDTGQ